jgi:hypothetical protein
MHHKLPLSVPTLVSCADFLTFCDTLCFSAQQFMSTVVVAFFAKKVYRFALPLLLIVLPFFLRVGATSRLLAFVNHHRVESRRFVEVVLHATSCSSDDADVDGHLDLVMINSRLWRFRVSHSHSLHRIVMASRGHHLYRYSISFSHAHVQTVTTRTHTRSRSSHNLFQSKPPELRSISCSIAPTQPFWRFVFLQFELVHVRRKKRAL